MAQPLPSDHLQDVYEVRGRLEYPEPIEPDPATDRKFAVVGEELRRLLPVRSLLDAGCGDGRYLAALPSLGPVPPRIVGADIAESILRTAVVATSRSGLEVEFVRANLEAMPFADGEFDLVVCLQAIEHLVDPGRGLQELARVLAPGGCLLLTTDNRRNYVTKTINAPRWALLSLAGRRRSKVRLTFPHCDFERSELEAMLEDAGLVVEHTRTFRFYVAGAGPTVMHICNRIDARLPDLGFGDVLLVVARRGDRRTTPPLTM